MICLLFKKKGSFLCPLPKKTWMCCYGNSSHHFSTRKVKQSQILFVLTKYCCIVSLCSSPDYFKCIIIYSTYNKTYFHFDKFLHRFIFEKFLTLFFLKKKKWIIVKLKTLILNTFLK